VFDLEPVFDQEYFVRNESELIATDLLAGLAAIYAQPGTADVCRYFTEQGWREALAFDPRLRSVERGESIIAQDHVLRIAFEGTYDLRERPPVIPLDIVYDIPVGATTKDLASGETRTSASDARDGFHADVTFDGLRWRVDRLGPIADDYRQWIALPTIPPAAPPCTRFVRDPDGSPFDENGERPWCEVEGRGQAISRNQVVLWTRYPCDKGKAAILHIGRPLGTRLDLLVRWDYVRDPANEFLDQHWITERYDGDATMPEVYVVRGDGVERWPRAAEPWGVIDCN